MDLLGALGIFRRAAERESFAVAARDLGFSQATVTRAVQALERHFGAELLRRSTRRMTLTAAGRLLLERGGALLDAAQLLKDELGGADRSGLAGRLRVTAPSGFGSLVLAPLAAGFADRHPKVKLDLICTDRYLDLVRENIDLAFRVGSLEDSSLRARAVARLPEVLVAAPDYLDRHHGPVAPGDISLHPFVGLSILRGPARTLRLSTAKDHVDVQPADRITFDTPMAVRQCLLAGGGIGRIHLYIVAEDIGAGRLRQVLPDWQCPTWTMNVVRTARAATRVAEAFLDAFTEACVGLPGLEAA